MSGILIASMTGGPKGRVRLSGSGASPNQDTDFAVGAEARAGWNFLASGDATKISGSAHNKAEWFGIPGETTHETPDQTYYIRATLHSGSNPDSGSGLGSWLTLSSSRFWQWEFGPGFGSSEGVLKIEISDDASGSPIIDTGYYKGRAEGEL